MATEKKSAGRKDEKPKVPRVRKSVKKVTFTYDNPGAKSVSLTGTFCHWKLDAYPLEKDENGVWKISVSLPAGRHEYRFIVDGEWTNDPRCSEVVSNEFGSENCVFSVD
ncbi:MAG TPA: glycogen-binding domain-containing protein [Spirochaetia bacterium]|nr:glycogen-binding domain-containing protein [Spirochaetia bacterium]